LFAGSAVAEEFCALSVDVLFHDGSRARLQPVQLIDSSGKVVFDQETEDSQLHICDFGFGPHKLVVGYGFCYQTTISGLQLRLGYPIHLTVRLNECPRDVWRGGCVVYLRVRESNGSPIDHVNVSLGPGPQSNVTDRFGRVEVRLGFGKSAVATISKDAYLSDFLPLRCAEAEEFIEKEIEIKRSAR
jgi:hypothetical protein